jgi:type I restriction enzyme S subunit
MRARLEGWRVVKLKDVCERITVGHVGPMVNEYIDRGVPFLRSQNVQPFSLDLSDVKYISPGFHKKLQKSALYPGDVAIVRTGYPGTACVIPPSLPVANCADLVIARPSDELDGRFLAAIFNSTWGRSHVAGSLVGVAQQHFNVGVAKEMEVFLPVREVQTRVADVLSAYGELIENNTRRIAILEEMAQAIYREWFVSFRFPGHEQSNLIAAEIGLIPEGWEIGPLGRMATEVRRSVDPNAIDPSTPYFGLEHFPRRSIALAEWGSAGDVQSTKLAFRKGEILFGKIRPYFHKVGIAPSDGVCSSDAIVIVPTREQYAYFVLMFVSSDAFVQHATQTSHGTKMPRANWNVLVKHPVAVAPEPLLDQFTAVLDPMVRKIQNLIIKNRNLRHTRDLLLPELISGEIEVGVAEDALIGAAA